MTAVREVMAIAVKEVTAITAREVMAIAVRVVTAMVAKVVMAATVREVMATTVREVMAIREACSVVRAITVRSNRSVRNVPNRLSIRRYWLIRWSRSA